MRVRDLGEMEGEVLLFGGPYSNLHALQALQDRAGAQGLPPERAICTGDVAAYCADPGPSVSLLRDWGAAVVAGNCERQIAAGAGDCGCGFEAGTACDLLSRGWYAHFFRSSHRRPAHRCRSSRPFRHRRSCCRCFARTAAPL